MEERNDNAQTTSDAADPLKSATVSIRVRAPRTDLFAIFVYVLVAGALTAQAGLIAWLVRL